VTQRREEGYILAGVTLTMAVLAILAAALVIASAEELRRVAHREDALQEDALLRSAILLAADQISLAPNGRTVRFENGTDTLTVEGAQVDVFLEFESDKLDLNRATPAEIRAQAERVGMSGDAVSAIQTMVEDYRGRGLQIRLVDDVMTGPAANPDCVHRAFTVFGGQAVLQPERERVGEWGRVAPGSRLAVTARMPQTGGAITAVLLMTGNPQRPCEILDWRRHAIQTEPDPIGACANV
jgi:hypothetical protein